MFENFIEMFFILIMIVTVVAGIYFMIDLNRLDKEQNTHPIDHQSMEEQIVRGYVHCLKHDIDKRHRLIDMSTNNNGIKTHFHQIGDKLKVSFAPNLEKRYRIFLYNDHAELWYYYDVYEKYNVFIKDVNEFLRGTNVSFRHGKVVKLGN